MFMGTIDVYHFIPLSVALIMDEDDKVSTKQNLSALFSRTLFSRTGMKFGVSMKQCKLTILSRFLREIYDIKRSECCFTDCIKKHLTLACILKLQHVLVQTWCYHRYYLTLFSFVEY